MFQFSTDESFPNREERVLRWWQENNIFQQSLQLRNNAKQFTIYDGPPFATGLPHYGHLLAGTIKDVVPRYKTMKGYFVPRRFGWDCHGLPIENEIEKGQALSGAASIEAFGIARFNEECRSIVLRYTSEWKAMVDRMGRWVDFDNAYRTMDLPFMESVWWVFKELHQRGLIYQGFKVMPFSMQLGTPLSNFEANLNYKDVDDPSVVIAFADVEMPNTLFLAWTTTPWTLPSNLALMVSPEAEYVTVKPVGSSLQYVLAAHRVGAHFKEAPEVVSSCQGKDLVNRRYRPLFDYFAARSGEGAFRILADEAVQVDEGTGIVHSAPAFGELDFYVCKREGIEIVCPVDVNGRFTKEVPAYEGKLVKDADKEIIRDLKKQGSVFSHATIRHRYPFCWRSDTPLIYKAVSTWFVAVETMRADLLRSNEQIQWMPEHIKEGRFGKWLENARDWAISRNRYWGTPIPIWQSEDGDTMVIGSVAELEALTKTKIEDLHRHHIDQLTFVQGGKTYRRISEVFDCWFESGSMPYAEQHYPFSGKEVFQQGFPADFIAEGLDQTRGWFYTLTVLATALFHKPAFKNVVVNGIILAEDGNKMSKRLRNYPDPKLVIDRYGADAVRLYMLASPAVKADDLRFAEKGVEHVLRQVLIPLWNAFVFLSTYADIYGWQPERRTSTPSALIDRWMLSKAQRLISDVEQAMDRYDLASAVEPFVAFVDQLTNWYIRRSRSRFWASDDTPARKEAFQTLYATLLTAVKVAAPFVPFIAEAMYQELKTDGMPNSVHCADFPIVDPALVNRALELEVGLAQDAVSLGHAVRKEHKLKVRQPLKTAHVITADAEQLTALKKSEQLIADELNVKTVLFHLDESDFVRWTIKPRFPVLGKKVGKAMPAAQAAIQTLTKQEMVRLLEGQTVCLTLPELTYDLKLEDVEIERHVKQGLAAMNRGVLTVALDTELTPDLIEEGFARELVNKLNTMRKDAGLHVTDRIAVVIDTSAVVTAAFQRFKEYIVNEVLAVEVTFAHCEGTEWDLNGERAVIAIQKSLN
ncbi:MAG: Isoleucine--tRNA ligase [Chlamydiota bacterium]|jgi:isoleucyl-tRNA synthetase